MSGAVTSAVSGAAASAAPTTAVIELRGVVKEYPSRPPLRVLHGIDLTIRAGERIAVVGASGSGKSTMLSLMGTLDRPTSGSVIIDGVDTVDLDETSRAQLRSRRLGFVFQQFFLLAAVSAVQNVELGLLYSGVRAAERRDRAMDALERVGLAARARHRPGELSGGEQQRVAIARALVRDPAVLFADEPTGALDSVTSEAIVSLLLAAADRGTAVVIVTHDHDIAARMGRRISVHDGRIVEDSEEPA